MDSRVALMGEQYVATDEARIDVRSQGFNYGASVFEGIRAYWSSEADDLFVFRLPEHLERLRRSALTVGLSLPGDTARLTELIVELVRRNEFREDVYIRPIAYKGVPNGLGILLTDAPDEFVVYTFALGEYLPRSRPLRVCVSSWQRISDNAVPARCKIGGSYINPALAKTEAVANGFDECLMLTAGGTVAEGTTSNLFLVHDGQLVTPSSTEDILIGITRDAVITLAQDDLGLRVDERPVDRSELYQADELFLCGTGAELAPVGEVDGRVIGDGEIGPVAAELRDRYLAAARGGAPEHRHWLTPVYGTDGTREPEQPGVHAPQEAPLRS